MFFAIIFGAGNLIFPPMVGYQAGEAFLFALAGFLATAVGLFLASMFAVGRVQGRLSELGQYLPKGTLMGLTVLVFLVVGPFGAIPRAAVVAHQMGGNQLPLFGGDWGQLAFALVLISLATWFAWSRERLLYRVGIVLAPLMLILLAMMTLGTLAHTVAAPAVPVGEYAEAPFFAGFINGYSTMDAIGAILVGMLGVSVLRGRGLGNGKAVESTLRRSAVVAAIGLTIVYLALFYLGATAGRLGAGADHGGMIIAAFFYQLLGPVGIILLAVLAFLVCLTTVVGLLSACADFFERHFKALSYRRWLLLFAGLSVLVSYAELDHLLAWSQPLLLVLYPMALVCVLLTLVAHRLPAPHRGIRLVVLVCLVVSCLDALEHVAAKSSLHFLSVAHDWLPLAEVGLAWILPVAVAGLIAAFMAKVEQAPAPIRDQDLNMP